MLRAPQTKAVREGVSLLPSCICPGPYFSPGSLAIAAEREDLHAHPESSWKHRCPIRPTSLNNLPLAIAHMHSRPGCGISLIQWQDSCWRVAFDRVAVSLQ